MAPKSQWQPPTQPPEGQISIHDIIGMYIGIASITTPTTEMRNQIIERYEKIIYTFALSLNSGN